GRPALYALVPIGGFVAGVLLFTQGEAVFWRVLAYVAVFHFVRQQAGWVLLYRARAGERDRLGRALDLGAVYAATVYPLLWWHAHLPRRLHWFLPRDLAALPAALASAALPPYVALLAAYAGRAARRYPRRPRTPAE